MSETCSDGLMKTIAFTFPRIYIGVFFKNLKIEGLRLFAYKSLGKKSISTPPPNYLKINPKVFAFMVKKDLCSLPT